MARGGLHRRRGDHLHHVIHDDVTQGADRVVKMPAILDPEAFRHRDLHRGDVVAVQDRLEDRVREPQHEDLDQAHLAQEVVDPVELRLVDVLVDLVVELPGRLEVVAKGLLDHDPSALRQPSLGQPLDDGAEEEGRYLEVEDRGARPLDLGSDALEGPGVREVAGHIGEPCGQPIEDLLVQRLPRALDRVTSALAEIVHGPVVDRHPDDGTVEQAAALQPVQRAECHHLGEIPGDPEDDQHVGGLLIAGSGLAPGCRLCGRRGSGHQSSSGLR